MLDEIQVTDVALIRTALLRPGSGLTAITGETGAGKTALLGALKLIVGERSDVSMVREGSEELQVEARFFDRGNSDDHVVARTVSASGRSRVRIDGALASVAELSQSVGRTVDLCGQHEHQLLMKVSHHREMLDAWAGTDVAEAAQAYSEAYQAVVSAQAELEQLEQAGRASSSAVDQARFVLARIDEVDPTPGEYEDLCQRVPLIENAEALSMAVAGAHQALDDEGGALDSLNTAVSLLEKMADVDTTLGAAAESLRDATYIVEDVARDVRSYGDGVEYDAQSLQQMQERMGAMQGLMRNWGPTMDEVFAQRQSAQDIVAATDGAGAKLARAQKKRDAAEAQVQAAGENLHQARCAVAPDFAAAVSAQMARLELAGATLQCAVDLLPRDKWTAEGPSHIEFMFRPNATMKARPLVKIASGGEVSRVMLAIKVVLGSVDSVQTLVFDEVDAGVGGSAARALADVLVDLARTHQVLVVTHLPQVAARASVQYRVFKSDADLPETTLEPVEGEARVREIARMLSGSATDTGLAHARELLAE